jgi:hypothetical protein
MPATHQNPAQAPPPHDTQLSVEPAGQPTQQPYDASMPDAIEYRATSNAHDTATLTRHMNDMARDGWRLLAVNFTHRGSTGYHTFFWQRPLRAAEQIWETSP